MGFWEILAICASITGILGFVIYLVHLISQKKEAQQLLDTAWRLTKIGAAVAVIVLCMVALITLMGWWPKWDNTKGNGPIAEPTKPLDEPDDMADMKASPSGDFTNHAGMMMKRVKGGSFRIGSPDGKGDLPIEKGRSDDEDGYRLELSDFHIGVTEVTVGQFRSFVEYTGYETEAEKHKDTKTWRNAFPDQTDNHPVVCVSWNDAKAFCDWLRRKEKLPYRLPTEAEWEFACRAGNEAAYCFGNDPKGLDDYAWYRSNSGSKTHEVATTKMKNGLGLYDMHGNVWEWCEDRYAEKYNIQDKKDPKGSKLGDRRVRRGGSWDSNAGDCRAAFRIGSGPASRLNVVGFRVACPAARAR
jgi:formylglycine-generating enzyme required for sulfatase activity